MGQLEVATLGEIGALLELAQGFAGIVEHSIGVAKGLSMISTTTGINIVELQKWGEVAEESGWKATSMTAAMESVAHSMANIRQNQPDKLLILASDLGINLSGLKPDDPFGIIGLIKKSMESGALKGKPAWYVSDMLVRAGINPELMMVLKQSWAEIEKMKSHTNPMTLAQAKTYADIGKQFAIFKSQSDNLRHDLADWVAPTLLTDLKACAEFIVTLDAFFERHKIGLGKIGSELWEMETMPLHPKQWFMHFAKEGRDLGRIPAKYLDDLVHSPPALWTPPSMGAAPYPKDPVVPAKAIVELRFKGEFKDFIHAEVKDLHKDVVDRTATQTPKAHR